MSNSSLTTGDGCDSVTINQGMSCSSISLGDDDDTLTLGGYLSSDYTGNTFDGGDGNDKLVLSDFNSSELSTLADTFRYDSSSGSVSFNGNTFKGFEAVTLGTTDYKIADFSSFDDVKKDFASAVA